MGHAPAFRDPPLGEPEEARGFRALSVAAVALAALAAGIAALYVVTAVSYIAAYSWRHPLFDQLRQYLPLLEMKFPANLLALENGHRPIFPNLIRFADIALGRADQTLSIAAGIALSLGCWALVAYASIRQKGLRLAERASAILLGSIAIYWLGNTRMLLHANESIQVYLTTLSVIAMGLCMQRAGQARPMLWTGLACAACFVATFSFGAGIATFPALVMIGVMQRLPSRAITLAVAALVATFILYVFVLPGDDGVRESLALRPVDSLLNAARWLAGPIVNGWLGLADPAVGPWLQNNVREHGAGWALVSSAEWAAEPVGSERFVRTAGALIGLAALATVALLSWGRLRRPGRLGILEAQGMALALFGGATGMLIGVTRLEYFDRFPNQIFGDRYGVWPCLFWLGLGLVGLVRIAQQRSFSRTRLQLPLVVLFVAATAWPSHLGYRGWGVAVYRNAERGAAAALLGIQDPALAPSPEEIAPAAHARLVDVMRRRSIGVFSQRSARWIGKAIPLLLEDTLSPDRAALRLESVQSFAGQNAMAFSGWVGEHMMETPPQELLVIDGRGVVIGAAQWSHDPHATEFELVSRRHLSGFDGYIRVDSICGPFTLVGLSDKRARRLAVITSCAAH